MLQKLIAQHPAVLTGRLEGDSNWILINREVGIPDRKDGGGRFSVDHLFLDSEAVPTFVEVKKADSRELRRGVVGQMLDYVANGVQYLPAEYLRDTYSARHGDRADELLSEALGNEVDVDNFWRRVDANLKAGLVRMVFVADAIPRRLIRVIEFLNGQLHRAEVLGIEVKQYRADDVAVLVPRVVGQTAQAEQAKGTTLDFDDRLETADASTRSVHFLLETWADENDCDVTYAPTQQQIRKEGQAGSFALHVNEDAVVVHLGPIRKAGLEREAETLRDQIKGYVGGRVTKKNLRVPCQVIDEKGLATFIDVVVRRYWELRNRAAE